MNQYDRRRLRDNRLLAIYNKQVIAYNAGRRKSKPTIDEAAEIAKIAASNSINKKLQFLYDNPQMSLDNMTDKTQYFYILEFENGVKFGRTAASRNRMLAYTHPWCRPVLNKWIIPCFIADFVESILQRRYKHYLLKPNREFIANESYWSILKYTQEIMGCINRRELIPEYMLVPKNVSPKKSST